MVPFSATRAAGGKHSEGRYRLSIRPSLSSKDIPVGRNYAVFIEEYERKVGIEGKIALGMATGMIAPVVAEQYSRLARTIAKAAEARLTYGVAMLRKNAEDLGAGYEELETAIDTLRKAIAKEHAETEILEAMAGLRKIVDRLELIVDDALWPLPKYREMLFIY